MAIEKLEFAGLTVELDSENLRFNESSLGDYIQREGSLFDHFGAFLALAERNLQNKESMHDRLYNERFVEAKESGAAVALAEAKAKIDSVVLSLKDDVIEAKYVVNRLKQHLRAWDKNHDNAQSMGHMQRKLMDKLKDSFNGPSDSFDREIERTTYSSWDTEDSKDSGFETELNMDNLY